MNTDKPTGITPKQAAARRANGRLSRGPTTSEGKAISSKNALKHGFFALEPLLPGESETEFAAFRDGLLDSFQPANQAENFLVNRVADSGWRLRRFPAVEAALFSSELLAEQSSLVRSKARGLLRPHLQALPKKRATPRNIANCFRRTPRSAGN